MYTLLQIFLTGGIFAVTFTPGAPVFPVIIVLLVPVRLKVMNRYWARETLKHVDSWACRPGETLDGEEEEEEEGLKREYVVQRGGGWEGMAEEGRGMSSALDSEEKQI